VVVLHVFVMCKNMSKISLNFYEKAKNITGDFQGRRYDAGPCPREVWSLSSAHTFIKHEQRFPKLRSSRCQLFTKLQEVLN
jgi:hypothetical protein